MELTAIENLSFAELKAKRGEMVESLGGSELASRYVQARTDAKHRDERAAEMAKEREALQARVDALGLDVLAWQKRVADLEAAAKAMQESYQEAIKSAAAAAAKEIQAERERSDKNAAAADAAHARIAELEGKLSQFRALAGA